ncbi:MAG: hypothetical protein IJX99_01180 [Clostridia bacterium]|nr:hypothetical protein [Clostridia bacterium]
MGTLKEKLFNKKIVILVIAVVTIIAGIFLAKTFFNSEFFNELIGNNKEENATGISNIYASISTYSLKGTKNGVDEFLKLVETKNIKPASEDMNNCFNITPEFVANNSEYQIFKFADTAESFLVYQDEIYKIGNNKRGKGILNFALADNNQDDILELYYSYEWSVSEVLRSNVAYFDPVSKKEIGLNKNYREQVVLLVSAEQNSELWVYTADISNYKDSTNLNITPRKESDVIVNAENSIKLVTRIDLENLKNK